MSVHCCMPVPHRGHKRTLDSLDWSQRQLKAALWILGIKPGPSEEYPVVLTSEPFLYPPRRSFLNS